MVDRTYRIVFKKAAFKEYSLLPSKIRTKIDEALKILSINPLSSLIQFKKIRGREDHYRIRVGDYRIVYSVHEDCVVITIVKVGHRKDVYKFF